ncbi:MAG: hypothetical protein Q9169_000399 [Polycauliona sp. 2 TL-2023]
MATNAAKGAAKQLQSGRTANSYLKKYTVQTTGIWDRIRRALAVDPNRSSGIPLNPQYRNPPPGANPPGAYDDPVTVPAGDIAENAYFRRDVRRSYPRLSVVKQGDVVGLLTVGSKAKPKDDVLQIGDAGAKQLMQVQEEGEERGLAALFQQEKTSVTSVLGPNGMPPFPTGGSRTSPEGGRKYVMDADRVEGYPEEYPCRTFIQVMDEDSMLLTSSHFSGFPRSTDSPAELQLLHSDTTSTLRERPSIVDDAARRSPPETMDFILSCSICQDTLSAVYAQHGNNDGLHQGTDDSDGAITKFWLTECAHLTCAKHLEGGGVPFHPKDQLPKAPCPLCVRNNQDHATKILYAIRGTAKGEYDSNIPPEYFEVPPQQLGNSGNEALRYVSLVRFASGLHESLQATRRELYTWKDRESSIVACLAAMEPLSRALQSARDQLHQLRGDVSLVDNALRMVTNLRVNAALSGGRPPVIGSNEILVPPTNVKTPAGSLLARGSALDLQSIQEGLILQDNRDQHSTHQANQCIHEPSPKKRRLESAQNLARQHQHDPDAHTLRQRLDSRDAMPPPPERPPRNPLSHQRQQRSSSEFQDLDPYSTGAPKLHRPVHESTTALHNSSPLRTEVPVGYSPHLIPNRNYPNTSRSGWEQTTDGELDTTLHPSIPEIHSVGHATTPRLTLPPSTPAFRYTTPRHRVGISANARTSQPPFLQTPDRSYSLQGTTGRGHHNPAEQHNYHHIVASPHFSNKTLPSFHNTMQRPYTNGMTSFPTVPTKTFGSSPHKLDGPTSQNFSWLPAQRGQAGRRQDQHKADTGMPDSRSGAFSRPGGGARRSVQQPLSLNSFSFTNRPHIGNSDSTQRRLDTSSVNHGRRAVRR